MKLQLNPDQWFGVILCLLPPAFCLNKQSPAEASRLRHQLDWIKKAFVSLLPACPAIAWRRRMRSRCRSSVPLLVAPKHCEGGWIKTLDPQVALTQSALEKLFSMIPQKIPVRLRQLFRQPNRLALIR
jgi:hypothetical protein